MKVGDLMITKFVSVSEDTLLSDVALKVAGDVETLLACVIDKNGKLEGIITPKELLKVAEIKEFGSCRYPFCEGAGVLHILSARTAGDIMVSPIYVKPGDEAPDAIDIMLDRGLYELPVVDSENKVIGEINFFGIIRSSIDNLKEK